MAPARNSHGGGADRKVPSASAAMVKTATGGSSHSSTTTETYENAQPNSQPKCSCGLNHGSSAKGGWASPTKAVSPGAALKRQRELRDFATIDRLLSRIFWLRFYEDAARLYSTRLTLVAKERLPFLVQNVIASGGGPGWACANAANEELREFFRLQIQIDLRELEDRIWHISSEWTYTAIRRMAMSNGFIVSSSGLRATELLGLIPLLEAMCAGLENAPRSNYEIQPVQAIAATFLNLNLFPSVNTTSALATDKKTKNPIPRSSSIYHNQICSHHPGNSCALDMGSEASVWGPSLFKITSSAFDKHPRKKVPKNGSAPSDKNAMAEHPATALFDALFPDADPLSSFSSKITGQVPVNPPTSQHYKGQPPSKHSGFTEHELQLARTELRSILSLGLSRLFIVLFQTAQEFNLRSFGENVNLAFGGAGTDGVGRIGGSVKKYGQVFDDEHYTGCDCCGDEYPDPTNPFTNHDSNDKSTFTDHDDGSDFNTYERSVASKRRSSKRAQSGRARSARRASSRNMQNNDTSNPYSGASRAFFSPRPGAGLKAWDTVLHYETVIREEEEERIKKEEDKKAEREKYGLKADHVSPHDEGSYNDLSRPQCDDGLCEINTKRRAGKGRESAECDGRGGGVLGWDSCHEEDMWERDLDGTDDFGIEDYFGFVKEEEDEFCSSCRCRRVALRYLMAEEYKEEGNTAFKGGSYEDAIEYYTQAHKSEPRLPIYLLNRSMAYLKMYMWEEAEQDCSAVLKKHRVNAKALWRRAKARRALSQLTGDVDKLIEAERDLLDFLAILPGSMEGLVELASLRAELCPCFECTENLATSSFCSSSSSAPPTSCFNKGYRPHATLRASAITFKSFDFASMSRSAEIFGAPPKGWLSPPLPSPTSASAARPKSSVMFKQITPVPAKVPMQNSKPVSSALKDGKVVNTTLTVTTTPMSNQGTKQAGPGFGKPWFATTPTGLDRNSWKTFVQDFSLLPESVSAFEDRMPLKFVSDHHLPSATLPSWDLYRVEMAGGKTTVF